FAVISKARRDQAEKLNKQARAESQMKNRDIDPTFHVTLSGSENSAPRAVSTKRSAVAAQPKSATVAAARHRDGAKKFNPRKPRS
ncbi:hypothetical protein EV182_006880, partial [Spiromyces aspiralis]